MSTGTDGEACGYTTVARQAVPYRLVPPGRPVRGRAGDHPGGGPGSSLEFMDYRGYQPGDDLRRIDWRGYARTDQLQVRLYREEIAPFVDIIVDLSASMAATPQKEHACRELAVAVRMWAGAAGGHGRLLQAGGGDVPEPFEMRFGGADRGCPTVPLRPRGWRVWITDALWNDDPAARVREIATGAAQLDMIQLLDPWERDPEPGGDVRLIDCETNTQCELALDEDAVARYRKRLERLQAEVRRAAAAAGGRFVSLTAGSVAEMARDLTASGLLEPGS